MKKVVILGCENTHADTFLTILEKGNYPHIQVIGAYSEDASAALNLQEKFGVPAMKSYDEAVGKVDGIIITARHGAKHYPYAEPYIDTCPVMFIDKPITIEEEEALTFMGRLREKNVRICGGSCCKEEAFVKELKKDHEEETDGETAGGLVRAPINMENEWGGFYFYAQHLVETVLEIYGRYPESVRAKRVGKSITVDFFYPTFAVTGLYYEKSKEYYAARFTKNTTKGGKMAVGEACFTAEFNEFYRILQGGEQKISYEDFIAPVFVLNAICRAMESGKEEAVKGFMI